MKIIVILVGLFLFLAFYIRYLEKATMFYPSKEVLYTPESIGLAYEDVYIVTQDGIRLNGWLILSGENAPTFVFLHGNAGNISDRLGKIQLFHDLGINVFIIDYRGYGKSQGSPSEGGMYLDAQAAFDYLQVRDGIDQKKIVGYGASLGGSAAVDLASQRELSALIVDSSFSNARDMAKIIYPWAPSFLVQTKLDSLSKIKRLKMPKMFIHSTDDTIVPFSLGQKLFNAAQPPKVFLELGGSHNDAHEYDREKFVQGIESFLKSHKLLGEHST